ncbi:hypothetical protein D9M68_905490 [compost metagenome]
MENAHIPKAAVSGNSLLPAMAACCVSCMRVCSPAWKFIEPETSMTTSDLKGMARRDQPFSARSTDSGEASFRAATLPTPACSGVRLPSTGLRPLSASAFFPSPVAIADAGRRRPRRPLPDPARTNG